MMYAEIQSRQDGFRKAQGRTEVGDRTDPSVEQVGEFPRWCCLGNPTPSSLTHEPCGPFTAPPSGIELTERQDILHIVEIPPLAHPEVHTRRITPRICSRMGTTFPGSLGAFGVGTKGCPPQRLPTRVTSARALSMSGTNRDADTSTTTQGGPSTMAGSPPQGPTGTQHDCRTRSRIGGCSRSGPLTHFPCSQVGSSYTRRHISTDCGSSRSISRTPDTQIPHSGYVHHQISLIPRVVCHIGGQHQSILPCSTSTKATEGLCVRRRPPKISMSGSTVWHRPPVPYILTHLMSPGVAPLHRTGV